MDEGEIGLAGVQEGIPALEGPKTKVAGELLDGEAGLLGSCI
jgi:hypothetical protein